MKKIIPVILLFTGLAACQSKDQKTSGGKLTPDQIEKSQKDTANYTTIGWPDSTFKDMGKVKQGEIVEVSFRFKNTGTKNLVFSNVSASCGCTVPEKPQQAFAPGEEGVIKAKFDSNGRPIGMAEKQVFVEANTSPSNSSILTFRVEITEK
ncbi:MAG: DUF1573 domain-containing protein [Chitinophagaceae bacterium]|nr:DUF1573 domain-containing protein [Chitinophagaceae bacterium]